MANLLKTWVESDKRELKRLGKIADKVESYAAEYEKLSDAELQLKRLNSSNATKTEKR